MSKNVHFDIDIYTLQYTFLRGILPMKNKYFYPAYFHKAEEGRFWISFLDIPECLTEGDDMAEAYEMLSMHWGSLLKIV